jgi:hypothetical protein
LLFARIFFSFLLRNEKDDDEPIQPISTDKNSIFNRLPISTKFVPRTRFRNFSHISEFGNGLDMPTKPNKKKDKISEFLEKKRERNTSKRLFGRKKTFE